MDSLIVKHIYIDFENDIVSDVSFDIFKNYSDLYYCLLDIYADFTYCKNLTFDENCIKVYRCGSVNPLGEFTIHTTALPIYLKEIKELIEND